MTYAGDLLRSGQGYSVSSADQIVMLCRLIARPDRIGFSAPKVEQAIDDRRERRPDVSRPLSTAHSRTVADSEYKHCCGQAAL